MNYASEISQLRKSGKIDEALARARACFAVSPDDLYIQRAYGWVLYELVKHEVEALEKSRSSSGQVANRFNECLAEYRQFGENDRPGMLHSLLLNQVLKGSRVWPGFLGFARWWGPEFLTDDDRKPYNLPNGKAAPSLSMRFLYAVGREALHQAQSVDSETLAWANKQVTTALAEYPDDQWLHYYQSKLLLERGCIAQAQECLMPVVRRQQRAAWVWTLLGQTFERENQNIAVTCYFRAVQVANKPMEVVKTRVALARLLATQERFDEATLQVRRALEYRTENDYKVPQELGQLLASNWYRERAGRNDLPKEPDVAEAAEAILYPCETRPIDYRTGVIDNQNQVESLCHVAFTINDGRILRHKKFKGVENLAVGEIIDVGFFAGDDCACQWRKTEKKLIDDFCCAMRGELTQRTGQSFGFLNTVDGDRVFVHPDLMRSAPKIDGITDLSCIAMIGKDKQGRPGWRALSWVM